MKYYNKIKNIEIIIIILIIFTTSIACSFNPNESVSIQANENAEVKVDKYFYDTAKGVVYTEVSDNFDVKIIKWECYHDEKSKEDSILLAISIKNKTGKPLEDFIPIILLNEEAIELIASGIITYDKYEPCDLIPKTTANGETISIDVFIEKDESLDNINADKENLFDKTRYVDLELRWKDGNETINLVLNELTKR